MQGRMLHARCIRQVQSPGLCKVALLAQLEARHGARGLAALPGDIQGDTLKGALRLDGGFGGRAWVEVPAAASEIRVKTG